MQSAWPLGMGDCVLDSNSLQKLAKHGSDRQCTKPDAERTSLPQGLLGKAVAISHSQTRDHTEDFGLESESSLPLQC